MGKKESFGQRVVRPLLYVAALGATVPHCATEYGFDNADYAHPSLDGLDTGEAFTVEHAADYLCADPSTAEFPESEMGAWMVKDFADEIRFKLALRGIVSDSEVGISPDHIIHCDLKVRDEFDDKSCGSAAARHMRVEGESYVAFGNDPFGPDFNEGRIGHEIGHSAQIQRNRLWLKEMTADIVSDRERTSDNRYWILSKWREAFGRLIAVSDLDIDADQVLLEAAYQADPDESLDDDFFETIMEGFDVPKEDKALVVDMFQLSRPESIWLYTLQLLEHSENRQAWEILLDVRYEDLLEAYESQECDEFFEKIVERDERSLEAVNKYRHLNRLGMGAFIYLIITGVRRRIKAFALPGAFHFGG